MVDAVECKNCKAVFEAVYEYAIKDENNKPIPNFWGCPYCRTRFDKQPHTLWTRDGLHGPTKDFEANTSTATKNRIGADTQVFVPRPETDPKWAKTGIGLTKNPVSPMNVPGAMTVRQLKNAAHSLECTMMKVSMPEHLRKNYIVKYNKIIWSAGFQKITGLDDDTFLVGSQMQYYGVLKELLQSLGAYADKQYKGKESESSAWTGFNTLEKSNMKDHEKFLREQAESSRAEDEVKQERIHNQDKAQEDFEKSIQEHNEELMEESGDEISDERIAEAQAHSSYTQPTENTIQATTLRQRFKKNGGMLAFQLVGLVIIWFIGRTFLGQLVEFDALLLFGAVGLILIIIEIVHIAVPEGGRKDALLGAAGKAGSSAGKLWGKGREKLGSIKEKGKSGWNGIKEGASRREPEGGWKEPIKPEEWKDHWKETG